MFDNLRERRHLARRILERRKRNLERRKREADIWVTSWDLDSMLSWLSQSHQTLALLFLTFLSLRFCFLNFKIFWAASFFFLLPHHKTLIYLEKIKVKSLLINKKIGIQIFWLKVLLKIAIELIAGSWGLLIKNKLQSVKHGIQIRQIELLLLLQVFFFFFHLCSL